jgi:hypothetical protein
VQRYRGLDAHFYHRGQRFVAEVAATCADLDVGRFDDVRDLAISSDVECAVTLRAAGILVYDGSLTERVDHGELVPAHSEREIEIRAATLHAADRLATAVAAQKPGVLPVDVDRWLRLAARRSIGQPHRTRSVHY